MVVRQGYEPEGWNDDPYEGAGHMEPEPTTHHPERIHDLLVLITQQGLTQSLAYRFFASWHGECEAECRALGLVKDDPDPLIPGLRMPCVVPKIKQMFKDEAARINADYDRAHPNGFKLFRACWICDLNIECCACDRIGHE